MTIQLTNGTEYSVADYTKEELINQLIIDWNAGHELTSITSELPTSIHKLHMVSIEVGSQATEEDMREQLESLITDEWDVLNDLIDRYDEDFAEACIEYANGGSLEYAEDNYIGQYDSNTDYCMEVFECPKNILPYIDWDAVWADYRHDVTEINGYYFNA